MEDTFGGAVDYAMMFKHYGIGSNTDQRRYSPSEFAGADKRHINGNPDFAKVFTSFVKRQNLTMRMDIRRFTQLTNGFSKKVENLEHAESLHFMHYNFARIHKTLRVMPAMEAGIAQQVCSIEDIVNLVPAIVAKKRGAYKPRETLISN